jgi:hypothetical protein
LFAVKKERIYKKIRGDVLREWAPGKKKQYVWK